MKYKAQTSQPAVSPARAAAFDILLRVERESSYASELLHSRTYERLTAVDHSLTTELVMGVLRWRSLLDSEIATSSAQPLSKLDLEILTALRLAVYQLRWLSRIPARAAINESVELVKRARKRSAAPFVNAVLRKLAVWHKMITARNTRSAMLQPRRLPPAVPIRCGLSNAGPRLTAFDSALRICHHNQSVPVTAIRLRRLKQKISSAPKESNSPPVLCLLQRGECSAGTSPGLPLFAQAFVSIQDEASQLVAALVGHGTQILDCCAAPGGKTAAIADHNPNAGIAAVELHPHRARLLRKLLTRT